MRSLVLAVLLAGPAAAQSFDGLYRPATEWGATWDCRTVGADGGAIAIGEGVLRGVETYCRLTAPVAVRGMSAVLYDMVCAGEGEEYTERAMLMTTPEGVAIITDGFLSEYQRCP